jgi:cell division protein FtsQ
MLTLLIAAMGKQKKDHCQGYVINLKGAESNFFIDEKRVEKLLKAAANGNIKGQSKASIQLQKMENLLEENVWIRDAEIYFDNKDVMHVSVTQRIPVARIFNIAGKSFYVDETSRMMPLSDEQTARVPVFTGFPSQVISKRDSALLDDVKNLALFIMHNSFWMAQIAQIDITEDRLFEIYPVVGNHVVRIGDATNIERKLDRLLIFYRAILSKTGFEKYAAIDVQYEGQVLGVKGDKKAKVDSEKLKNHIEKLLKEATDVPSEDEMAKRALRDQQKIAKDPVMSARDENVGTENSPAMEGKPDPQDERPKAVMGKIEQ